MNIVKRKGHEEEYDEKKVYASVYSSCLNCHLGKTEAEDIAAKVANEISQWAKSQKDLTSDQIFNQTTQTLKKFDQDVSFMYQTHRDLS